MALLSVRTEYILFLVSRALRPAEKEDPMIALTAAAAQNAAETGCDPVVDAAEVRRCNMTKSEFLAVCLNGADADRVQGWHDYVDAVCAAASEVQS